MEKEKKEERIKILKIGDTVRIQDMREDIRSESMIVGNVVDISDSRAGMTILHLDTGWKIIVGE